MTGEMNKSDVTIEAFPLHFAIAAALHGTLEPFDQRQGPSIVLPNGDHLFLCAAEAGVDGEDGETVVWNEETDQTSRSFWDGHSNAVEMAVRAAREVARGEVAKGRRPGKRRERNRD